MQIPPDQVLSWENADGKSLTACGSRCLENLFSLINKAERRRQLQTKLDTVRPNPKLRSSQPSTITPSDQEDFLRRDIFEGKERSLL